MSLDAAWQKQLMQEKPSWIYSLLGALYRFSLKIRHSAYDRGWVASYRVPACVVSIGNIACGGTGKTPIVQMIAKALSSKFKVAILSRGYRGGAEHFDIPLQISEGKGPIAEAALAGDEAYLHAVALPNVSVWAGKRRLRAAKEAIALGAELLLLDDGMQHRALQRDIEIVVFDGQDDLLKQRLLPVGRLRDLPERLNEADYLIVHHAPENLEMLASQLATYTTAPIIATRMSPTQECKERICGRKIAYFCAIGRPERFCSMLQSLSSTIVHKFIKRDHAAFDEIELRAFAKEAREKGAELLVCTKKDYVKLRDGLELSLPILAVDAEAEIVEGQNVWDSLINHIIAETKKRELTP